MVFIHFAYFDINSHCGDGRIPMNMFTILYFSQTASSCLQREEIMSCEERVKKLLEMTPPKGNDFLNKIEHMLEREKNWVRMFLISFFLCHTHPQTLYFMKLLMLSVDLICANSVCCIGMVET